LQSWWLQIFFVFLTGCRYNQFIMITQVITREERPKQVKFNLWLVYLFCLGISFVFMFCFGLNSPIYTFNSHCDFNWYVTMGRGLLAGKVPYRDLFEQKGPITYFVFALAALFPNYQIGVWLIEVLCISLFLFFAYLIARKFLSPWLSLVVVLLMMMALSANFIRALNGACVEEFCLPIFAYGLLCFLDFLMDRRPATWRRSLALGICLGILFWTKFSMWEFFLVPMLIWLVVNLVRRNFIPTLCSGLLMLGGFLLVSLPIVIYFISCHAFDDLWEVYFKVNLFNYNGDIVGLTQQEKTIERYKALLHSFYLGAYFILLFLWGIICFTIKCWKKGGWLFLLAVLTTWGMVGCFVGYLYYYIPLYAYAIIGAIYLVKIVAHVFKVLEVAVHRNWVKIVNILVVTVASFLLAMPFVYNLRELKRGEEDFAPLVVADIIAEYNATAAEPATLFCYQMSDCGFYNAAGIVPNVYYYARNSFIEEDFPEMFEAFRTTISTKQCDYLITYANVFAEEKDFLLTYYDFYFGTEEKSTLPFVAFEPSGYLENQIVVLFRR